MYLPNRISIAARLPRAPAPCRADLDTLRITEHLLSIGESPQREHVVRLLALGWMVPDRDVRHSYRMTPLGARYLRP